MANLSIPDKTTGDQHFAAEYQAMKDFINTPIASLGTYAGAAITIDGTGRYSRYTMAANMSITFATSGHKEGNTVLLPITADGTDTLTFTDNASYTIAYDDSLTSGGVLASGSYLFAFTFIAGEIQVSYISQTLITPDTTPPTVVSATVENADPDALVVVFSEAVTLTDMTGLSLNGSWTGVTISSLTSGSGTTTLTFALDTPIANGESGSFVYGATNNIEDTSGNGLVASSTAVTNNVAATSIIVMQDDFAGTVIDTGKWTETDPADGVTISQNGTLIFTTDRTSPVASTNTNRVDTVDSITNGCLQLTISGTEGGLSTCAIGLSETHGTDALAQILNYIDIPSGEIRARLRVWDATVSNDVDITGDSFKDTWRIRYDSSITTVYWDRLTGVDTWTNERSYVIDLGTNLTGRIGANVNTGSGSASWTFDNVYLTNDTYSTSIPT